jgi:hypothetical protein
LHLKNGMRYLSLSPNGLKNEPGEYFSNEFQKLKPLPYKFYQCSHKLITEKLTDSFLQHLLLSHLSE